MHAFLWADANICGNFLYCHPLNVDVFSGLRNGTPNGVPQVYVNNTVSKLELLDDTANVRSYCNGDVSPTLKREATVKDITQKLATLQTPDETAAVKPQNLGRVEEMKGIISKAMEGEHRLMSSRPRAYLS